MLPSLKRVQNHPLFRPLAVIALVSLTLRLVIYFAMLTQVDAGHLMTATPDVGNYFKAAQAISDQLDFFGYRVNMFGPGYPLFLVATGIVSGGNPWLIVLFQICIGALGSSLLAWLLTNDRKIAVVAGLLNAVSFCSISLANLLLSGTLYFVVLTGGLILFVRGLQTGRRSYYLSAAIIFGLSPLLRSIGTYFIGVIFVLAVIHFWPTRLRNGREAFVKIIPALLVTLIAASLLWAWTLRPRQPDAPPISYPAYNSMLKMSIKTRALLAGRSYGEEALVVDSVIEALKLRNDGLFFAAIMEYSKTEFFRLATTYPAATTETILSASKSNTNSDHTLIRAVLPNWTNVWDGIERWLGRYQLQYRVSILSLIGLAMLIRRRQTRLALGLAVIYCYFGLLSGLTLEWGNRLFYPGQIAWAILIAYPLAAVSDRLVRLGQRVRQSISR